MPGPIVKPIPPQIVNECAAYGPFNLKEFIQAPNGSPLKFSASLVSEEPLPKGLICTEDGILTGIPATGTQGLYEFQIAAASDIGIAETILSFTIQPALASSGAAYLDQLKTQVWEALDQNMPIPALSDLYAREISAADAYYLLERWGTLIIWDAFNLQPASRKVLLKLPGTSPHYHVYDRGSCLIGAPVDLYTYERTVKDGLMTARAMAQEVYKRNWTIEMAGFEKFTRAAWVEMQHLADQHGRPIEIINYTPSESDIKIYSSQVVTRGFIEKMGK